MLFPGQASQYVGMGKDYYDAFSEARDIYKSANRTLGIDITELSFGGDLDELTKTHNAQPAILVHSLAILHVLLARGFEPSIVAGHSLGEFSALVAAGHFKPMDALLIVRKRGELMYEAGVDRPGTMAAIMGLEAEKVEVAVEEASSTGIVVVANYNSPVQVAISGEVDAVKKAMEIAKEMGAKRAVQLQVSGAFHSPLMETTSHRLLDYIKTFDTDRIRVPWITNVTGEEVSHDEEVNDLLDRQLSSPVRWVTGMHTLGKATSGPVFEVGPGKVLTGLMKRIESGVAVQPLTDLESFEKVSEVGG